jgi:hypothetical protein
MELKDSLPYSQKTSTGPYPDPAEFSPDTCTLPVQDQFNTCVFPSDFFPSGILAKILYAFLISAPINIS